MKATIIDDDDSNAHSLFGKPIARTSNVFGETSLKTSPQSATVAPTVEGHSLFGTGDEFGDSLLDAALRKRNAGASQTTPRAQVQDSTTSSGLFAESFVSPSETNSQDLFEELFDTPKSVRSENGDEWNTVSL